ncbi:MAG: tetratricopeptide repeat protein [Steroidobacteraceae bacterium]
MKYTKALLVTASALGLATVAAVFLRPDDTRVAPSQWIQDAAVAFNRGPITGGPDAAVSGVTTGAPFAQHAAMEGQRLRVQRRFAEAAASFQTAVEADPMDADAWADLADSSAAAAGRDLTVGREAILRALAIDPRHRKALWLRASLELQEGRYADAAATWRELQPLVAAGSSDERVIAANIVEADALARPEAVLAGRGR